jgi:Cu/Zn superoxide dismutase
MRTAFTRTASILTVLAFAACAPGDEAETPPAEETTPAATTPATTPAPTPRTSMVVPGADAPTASGQLRITDNTDGSTELNLNVTGLPAGDHAWHIHSAACGTDGPIAVPITSAGDQEGIGDPFTVGEDGSGNATVTIPADRLSQDQIRMGQYSVHVHAGTVEQMGASLICAPLTAQ